jgi:predicted dehydrogenase
MRIALVGCGFVADFYMATLRHYSAFVLAGVYDWDRSRLEAFSRHHRVTPFDSLDALLADRGIEMVLNLTNPRSHFQVSRACLLAGKHVYSEKPVAMETSQAAELAALAHRLGLGLAGAPSSMLSSTCQTMWKALRDGTVGPVRLVYGNFDAGMTHRQRLSRWRSASGAPWPAKDEFETGCTLEHAGYILTWLAAWFGPARRVNAFSTCLISDKGFGVERSAPDFSVACVEYDDGVVARVTCSSVAPVDRSITIVGEDGILTAPCIRDDLAPVYHLKMPPNYILSGIGERVARAAGRWLPLPWPLTPPRLARRVRPVQIRRSASPAGAKPVDFMLGPYELAESLREGRPCRLSSDLAVHITELVRTIQNPDPCTPIRRLQTEFKPIAPLPELAEA